jgi:hypothetical protein
MPIDAQRTRLIRRRPLDFCVWFAANFYETRSVFERRSWLNACYDTRSFFEQPAMLNSSQIVS